MSRGLMCDWHFLVIFCSVQQITMVVAFAALIDTTLKINQGLYPFVTNMYQMQEIKHNKTELRQKHRSS